MTTTLLVVAVLLLALIVLRLIGRALSLLLRLALLSALAAVLIHALAAQEGGPGRSRPGDDAPRQGWLREPASAALASRLPVLGPPAVAHSLLH